MKFNLQPCLNYPDIYQYLELGISPISIFHLNLFLFYYTIMTFDQKVFIQRIFQNGPKLKYQTPIQITLRCHFNISIPLFGCVLRNYQCNDQFMTLQEAIFNKKKNKQKKKYPCNCKKEHDWNELCVDHVITKLIKNSNKELKNIILQQRDGNYYYKQKKQQTLVNFNLDEKQQLCQYYINSYFNTLKYKNLDNLIKNLERHKKNLNICLLKTVMKQLILNEEKKKFKSFQNFTCCRLITKYGVQGAFIFSNIGIRIVKFLDQNKNPLILNQACIIFKVKQLKIAALSLIIRNNQNCLYIGEFTNSPTIIMKPVMNLVNENRYWSSGAYDYLSNTFFLLGGKEKYRLKNTIEYLNYDDISFQRTSNYWNISNKKLEQERSSSSMIFAMNNLYIIGGEYPHSSDNQTTNVLMFSAQDYVCSSPMKILLKNKTSFDALSDDKHKPNFRISSDITSFFKCVYPRLVQIPKQSKQFTDGALFIIGGSNDPFLDNQDNRSNFKKGMIYNSNAEKEDKVFINVNQEKQFPNQKLSKTSDYGGLMINQNTIVFLEAIKPSLGSWTQKSSCLYCELDFHQKKLKFVQVKQQDLE